MIESEALKPTIANVTLTLANTEYPTPAFVARQIAIQCRSANDVYMAFVTGQVAGGGGGAPTGSYVTIKSGSSFSFPEKILFTGIIYFACASAGVVVEIVEYPARALT